VKELKQKNKAPPGGWRYTDPDTGFRFKRRYARFSELEDHVRRYRLLNDLPSIPSLSLVIQDWLCSQSNMESYCRGIEVVSRTLKQYLKGAQASAKMIAAGEKAYVPQQVAEARAEVCVSCRYNKKSDKHSRLQRYTDKYVKSMVGDRRTSFDEKLHSCDICSCPLRPKVHVSQRIIEESLTRGERKIFKVPLLALDGKTKFICWQIGSIKTE